MEPYQYAVAAAESGWSVFPLRVHGKQPPPGLLWRDRSTTDVDRVLRYGKENPQANWACDLGKSGLLVVDVDCKKKTGDGYIYDPAGLLWLATVCSSHEPPDPCSCVNTGSGGLHWWLQQPAEPVRGRTARGFTELVDVKSAGGYVLLPGCFVTPSVDHPSADGHYVCEEPPLTVQRAPDWLIGVLSAPKPQADVYDAAIASVQSCRVDRRGARGHLARLVDEVSATRNPGRNDALNSAAFKMRDDVATGLVTVGEVFSALLGACRANGLLKDDGERCCTATIASGLGVTGR